jgi:hypothetical protein
MSDNPNFNVAIQSFGQLEDKLMLAKENVEYAMGQENLSHEERRRLLSMARTLRTMTAQLRNAR